jgi:hypothetical protein
MSLAEGEELPPRVRRRYAARCFILIAERQNCQYKTSTAAHSAHLGELTFGCFCFWGTGDSINLTASWAETETSSSVELKLSISYVEGS